MRKTVIATAVAAAALGLGLTGAVAGTANAAVTVKVHSQPYDGSPVIGYASADCQTIADSPRAPLPGNGGLWYQGGEGGWVFNNAQTPFCH